MPKDFATNANGGVYYNTDMATPAGRARHATLTKPGRRYQNYSITILFDKKELKADPKALEKLEVMIKAGNELIEFKKREVYDAYTPKAKQAKTFEQFSEEFDASLSHWPIRDGDKVMESKGGEQLPKFPGKLFVSFNSKEPFVILGPDKKPGIAADTIKDGNIIAAVVQPMYFATNDKTHGIAWKVRVLQFRKDDGVRLYQGPDSSSFLDEVEPEEVGAADASNLVAGGIVAGAELAAAAGVAATATQAAPAKTIAAPKPKQEGTGSALSML